MRLSIPRRSHAAGEAEALDGPAPVARAPARIHGIDHLLFKETDVSHIKTTGEQVAKTRKVELLDCGQASKETKGFIWFLLFELSVPPFDRQLII